MSNHSSRRPFVPHTIHRLAVPILLFWVALAAVPNILVPQLEEVGRLHNVGLSSPEAPSYQAFKHIGKVFHEFDTDSSAMIVLEGDKPLGADAHKFYDAMVHKLEQDKKHVQHIQDFWGDTLTAAGSQSSDGKAAYVQLFLNGAQGEALSNESVDAVRATIDHMQPPPGVKAYLTGAAPLIADQFTEGSKGSNKVTAITIGVIAVMLFFVYRSFSTTLLVLATVLIEMAAARGFVAFLGNVGILGLSTYATNLLTLLVIAAGTDYAIFFVGRYHEARTAGEEREDAFYTMYRGTSHVVLGSGLTVASAVACLSFTRLPYFQSLGLPAAIGILVALAASLTLGPAILTIASHFGLFDPKRVLQTRGWRRIGTAIVRWPAPILVVSIAVALIGLLALPGYKTSYDTRPYIPGHCCGQRRIHRCRAALPPLPVGARTADDRGRPRLAESGRHAGAGQGGQGRRAHTRHRSGAVHHPAVGSPAGPQLDRISDQPAKHRPGAEPQVPNGPRAGPVEAIRRADENDRHPASAICPATAARRRHPRRDPEVPRDPGDHLRGARQAREFRRLLPAAAQLLLLGKALLRHPGVLRLPQYL